MATFEEYYNAIHSLLPQGIVWPESQETCTLNTLIEVVAQACKDVGDAGESELDDIFPDSSSPGNYLDDWERVLQLPKSWADIAYFLADTGKCGEPLSVTTINSFTPTTDAARRDAIVSFLNTSRLNNDQFYIDLAAELGFTATVTTTAPAHWEIDVSAGDLSQINTLISLANFFKPAHTKLEVIY
jgi:uncharacterized protein YmfQ (DUF2313 family)